MGRRPVLSIVFVCLTFLFVSATVISAFAQSRENPTATLKAVRAEGASPLNQSRVIALSGLSIGSAVGKQDLQSAADRLVQTGLFSNVNYVFQSKEDGLYLTFKLAEAQRIPAYFDNIPWFADSEINEAIRKVLPFYDGSLPEGGATVDQVSSIVTDLIASRGMRTVVEHQVVANPLGEGSVQEFRIADVVLQISKIEFSDPKLATSKVVQQHLGEIQGKTYSRMTVDLFLAEQVKPIYLQQGFLRAKREPPKIPLTGNPNQHLPDQIPVFVPLTPGVAYKWKGVQWSGNALLSVFTLNQLLGMKPGELANGMAIQGALEPIQE